jgi:uncharacterized small protein (DUF1192 family)
MSPYIPAKDSLFALWLLNFTTLLTASPASYVLTAPDALAVDTVADAFAAAYATAKNPTTRTKATVAAKDAARASAEAVVRPYAVRISRTASVSDALKIGIGVTVPGAIPTPVPPPTTAPTVGVERQISGATTLKFSEPGMTGKAKPAGVIGMEVFRSVGTVHATDPTQAAYVATATKSPVVVPNDPADAGKKVTYFFRWVTRSGPGGLAQSGPWTPALNGYAL